MNYLIFPLVFWVSMNVSQLNEQKAVQRNTLNVMSYNVKYCAPYKSSEPNVDSIAKIINHVAADIVFLQEIDRNTTRSGHMDQLALLAEKTGLKHYFYGKAIAYQGGETGLGILSRYPMEDQKIHKLPRVELEGKYVSYRILMSASIKVGSKRLTIANTHMELTLENRELQVPAIDSILSQSNYPVILGGDLNATPDGPTMASFFQRHFKSSCEGNASCYTIPSREPNRKLDYILFKPQSSFKIKDHQVIQTEASDHLPILTTFSLN
ncbi:endonuclease/exonuclease/phosphatase family protein [Echinicola sp. CAU 1574]|uniref:Endonuclease/exonuclease/phosphatase family protein n=1 Tax=Echinicola arenosa TaxID=2774144 RepID=A0ABR9AK20_9BACT|nr:endonuclease/exonuclease/phosphatase family protein [Echinicola arenosa]MBD8489143.1 endonuclease/exonuclease/phosphatase family protein [Echinicola arenosa]